MALVTFFGFLPTVGYEYLVRSTSTLRFDWGTKRSMGIGGGRDTNMFRKTVMRAGRQVLTVVLPFAVVATLANAGTASATDYTAQQTRWADSLSASGNEQGVEFKTTTAADLKSISTELNSGRFTLTADSSVVNVEST
ncbi:hypothetical protein, partial [Nocardia sp. XZ_19_369]|uniref:hypothetical protein n=1 Tax=Nocardia sp. XZ_19_369 TaxID=2769487 RepID=UPI00188E94B9